MKINKDLTPEEKQLLEKQGVVFEDGRPPYFRKKEAALPPGTMKLSSGRVIRRQPITECLKW